MILSTRLHRRYFTALKGVAPYPLPLQGPEDAARVPDLRPVFDPDWAIREIVDDMFFDRAH